MNTPRDHNYVVVIRGRTKAGAPLKGTGFMVDAGGTVVTCHHVVADAETLEIQISFTQPWQYRVRSAFPAADLAILECVVPITETTPFVEIEHGAVAIGDAVSILGCSATCNEKTINGITQYHYSGPQLFARRISAFSQPTGRIGIDGPVNHGDSGAPIVNEDGRVVAIAEGRDLEREGQSLAIPISSLLEVGGIVQGHPHRNVPSIPIRQRRWERIAIFAALTAWITYDLQIPIVQAGSAAKMQGYFDLGDAVVLFAGMYLGPLEGALVGGLGSAAVDLLSGAAIYAPITLFAKGVEATLAGLGRRRQKSGLAGACAGALCMVAIYYAGESLFIFGREIEPRVELPFNIAQAVACTIIALSALHICRASFRSHEFDANLRSIWRQDRRQATPLLFGSVLAGLISSVVLKAVWPGAGVFDSLLAQIPVKLYSAHDGVILVHLGTLVAAVAATVVYLVVTTAAFVVLLRLAHIVAERMTQGIRSLILVSQIPASIVYVLLMSQFFASAKSAMVGGIDPLEASTRITYTW